MCTVHKVLSCPPRSHEGKVSLPTQQRGRLPFLFCSRIQQPGAFSTGRLAKKSRSFVICRQTQLHFQLFTLKSFQIPGMLCRQLRGPRAPHGFPRPARLETRRGGLVTLLKELQVCLGSNCPSRCAGGSPACLPRAVSPGDTHSLRHVCGERDWAKGCLAGRRSILIYSHHMSDHRPQRMGPLG